MTTELRFKKDELIDALEARRPWAQEQDKKLRAQHEQEEKERIAAFRDECKRLAKLSITALKEEANAKRYPELRVSMDLPRCPLSYEARIDRALNAVKTSGQKTYRINRDSQGRHLYDLLTYDETIEDTVCS